MKKVQHDLEELHSGASLRHTVHVTDSKTGKLILLKGLFNFCLCLPVLVFCWLKLLPFSGSFYCSILMGPRNPSPDPLSESESEAEESTKHLNESSGKDYDSSEEEDMVMPKLTPL